MSSGPESQGFPQMRPSSSSAEAELAFVQPRSRAMSSAGIVGRRRRVPDSVTPNACTNCKKARAKCDGVKPACKRCVARDIKVDCHYEIHAKTAKEQMIREIQRLRKKNESLVEENDSLGERNVWIELIIESLKNDRQGTEIIRRLKRGETHQAIAEWLGRPLTANTKDLSPSSERQLSEAIESYHRDFIDNHDPRYWTDVTRDVNLIEHLLKLYFAWIHPVHMLFDEVHFMTSLRACSDTYCSAGLVNAVCAMACHLFRTGLDDDLAAQIAIDSLREQFMAEARSNIKEADYGKMTVIQTYAIMFLTELGAGSGQTVTSHLRLATESLFAKKHAEQSRESEEVASWGVLTLHTAWSGFSYQKPSAPISTQAIVFRDISLSQPDSPWVNYRQPGDESPSNRPCYAQLTVSELAKLYQVIHETILLYCAHEGKLAPGSLADLYKRYLSWKEDLPVVLRDVERDADALPHVLFLHIQYYTAMVNMLQPILELDQTHESYDHLQNLIITNARQGLVLLVQYQKTYGYAYQSPLQLFCTVHICDALVRHDGSNTSTEDVVRFCLECLEEAKFGYSVAGPLQQMFRLAVGELNVPVPDDLEKLIGPSSQYGPEEMLNACTRITYRPPMSQILSNMEPRLGQGFVRELKRMNEISDNGKPDSMKIDSLLNS